MENELAFTLHLLMYQEADLGDFITFMMNFRNVLIHLKPSEVIQVEDVCCANIIDLMMQVLPDHEPHQVPWFESFSIFEPADLDNEFMEQEAVPKGKAPLSKPYGLSMPFPNCIFWCTRRGNAMERKT
ncbi:hypothetical protein TNCV_4917001 [Trichonephila clavipes]|nr:hypothetical protein TNCV_4917001 [Trichonephila clavipes]